MRTVTETGACCTPTPPSATRRSRGMTPGVIDDLLGVITVVVGTLGGQEVPAVEDAVRLHAQVHPGRRLDV